MSFNRFPQIMHSGQIGAPQMTGAKNSEGQILQVLDGCLLTGFNPMTVAQATFEDDLIVFNFGVAHGYLRLQFLTITGATSPLLNGIKRIVRTTATTIAIAKGDVTDLAGTIQTKVTPLNWESKFGTSDPLKRAYRSKNLTGTRTILYLDCQNKTPSEYNTTNPVKKASFNACRDMVTLGVQIDSYTESLNLTQPDGKLHWYQSVNTRIDQATLDIPISWVLIGDGDIFYFFNQFSTYRPDNNSRALYFFGDLPKISNADQYNCVFSASEFNLPSQKAVNLYGMGQYNFDARLGITAVGCYFIKDVSGFQNLDGVIPFSMLYKQSTTYYTGNGGLSTFNPLTFGLTVSPVGFVRLLGSIPTGDIPYLKGIATDLSGFGGSLDLTYSGDHFLVRVAGNNSSGIDYYYFALNLMEQRKEDVLL